MPLVPSRVQLTDVEVELREYADPRDNGGFNFIWVANTNHVSTGPINDQRVRKCMNLESELLFLNLASVGRLLTGRSSFSLLRAKGHLPRSGAHINQFLELSFSYRKRRYRFAAHPS
jgi:hypothetical protein